MKFESALFVAAIGLMSVGLVSSPAVSQDKGAVIGQCQAIANGGEADGSCVNATRTYVADLKSSGASDREVIDLVLDLIPMSDDDGACTSANGEIGQAIAAVGEATAGTQGGKIGEIGEAVANCVAMDRLQLLGEELSPS